MSLHIPPSPFVVNAVYIYRPTGTSAGRKRSVHRAPGAVGAGAQRRGGRVRRAEAVERRAGDGHEAVRRHHGRGKHRLCLYCGVRSR